MLRGASCCRPPMQRRGLGRASSIRWQRLSNGHGQYPMCDGFLKLPHHGNLHDSPCNHQIRYKRTRTTVRLEDLPQGPLGAIAPLEPEDATAALPSKKKRPKKAKIKVEQDDDREGVDDVVETEGAAADDNEPAYPTVIMQAWRNMQKFANCVLLTRVGGFFELYFSQATEYGPLLNLKVATKKTNAGPVPMAGFPYYQLERFLKMLVMDLNCYVALAEEFRNDPGDRVKSGGLMHDRRVTRIISPGTLIDENFIDPFANNYIMAVHVKDSPSDAIRLESEEDKDNFVKEVENMSAAATADVDIGLAWLDISTGQFYTQSTTVASLSSILSRVSPKEIVLDEKLNESPSTPLPSSSPLRRDHAIFSALAEDKQLITFAPRGEHLSLSEWTAMLESKIPVATAQSLTAHEEAAGSLLLGYCKERLQGLTMKLQPPQRHEDLAVLAMDKNTMRSLEIRKTIQDGYEKGSLLHSVRRTVTKGGARLLVAWLSAPSTSLEIIKGRHDLVEFFLSNEDLNDTIVNLLRQTQDSQRLVQKFALGRGDADDMLGLASTIDATREVVEELSSMDDAGGAADCLTPLLARISLSGPGKLAERIRASIDEQGLSRYHEEEQNEANQIMAQAEKVVLSEEGRGDHIAADESLKKGINTTSSKKKSSSSSSPSSAFSAVGGGNPTSIRDYYNEDNMNFVMQPGASPGLKALHDQLSDLLEQKQELAETLRERFGAASLTLRWTPTLGHIVHVKGKDAKKLAGSAVVGGGGRSSGRRRVARSRGNDDININSSNSQTDHGNDAAEEAEPGEEEKQEEQEQGPPPPPSYSTVGASRSTRALHVPPWTRLGQQIHQTRFQIGVEETRLFTELRQRVVEELVRLRRNAAVLAELDVTTSFARLAAERGFTRPELNDGTAHVVLGGRHPTVEAGLREQGRSFASNDCLVGAMPSDAAASSLPAAEDSTTITTTTTTTTSPSTTNPTPTDNNNNPSDPPNPARIWLVTGPNMAGKSTYLRQNALITILAQCGSYVPARFAALGVVDAVYSRVGSGNDNLYADQSTFMVEMAETARILRAATRRSFVVMDEIGRGTTPADGEAVAFACLWHLARVNRCRALFATHFHGLADRAARRGMLATGGGGGGLQEGGAETGAEEDEHVDEAVRGAVDTYCTDVEEDGRGGFVYVHKLRRGVNRQSHALKVARLAGLPDAALDMAKEILVRSEEEERLRQERQAEKTAR